VSVDERTPDQTRLIGELHTETQKEFTLSHKAGSESISAPVFMCTNKLGGPVLVCICTHLSIQAGVPVLVSICNPSLYVTHVYFQRAVENNLKPRQPYVRWAL
jgi:hypothetical protein